MTYEEWVEKYRPMQNPLVPGASFDGLMFETFGDEVEFVGQQPPQNVWTYVDDGEHESITNGLCFVNRIGHFITQVPYDDSESPFVEVEVGF